MRLPISPARVPVRNAGDAASWCSSSVCTRAISTAPVSPPQRSCRNRARSAGGRSATCWNSSSARWSVSRSMPASPFDAGVAQPLVQPRAGEAPLALDRARRELQGRRGLLDVAAAEEAQQHDAVLARVRARQLPECLAEREDLLARG